jgi:hypothetical protein
VQSPRLSERWYDRGSRHSRSCDAKPGDGAVASFELAHRESIAELFDECV